MCLAVFIMFMHQRILDLKKDGLGSLRHWIIQSADNTPLNRPGLNNFQNTACHADIKSPLTMNP